MLSRERIMEIRGLRGRYEDIVEEGRRFQCPEPTARDIAAAKVGLDALLAVDDLLAELEAMVEEVRVTRDLLHHFEVWTGFDSSEVPHG